MRLFLGLILVCQTFCSAELIDHALVSVYTVHSDTGEVLISENCDLSMTPASCMKVVTTAAALPLLGANSRFETHLQYDGFIDEAKTLHGNITVIGGGDPTLGSERVEGSHSWQEQIALWANSIQNLGITKIEGKIIPDASRWESALAASSWSWEDMGNYYGAGASSLSFHENYYTATFRPGAKEGDSATLLRLDPPLEITIHNEVKTGSKDSGDCACIYGSEYSPIQFIRGTIPLGVEEFTLKGSIPDAASLSASLLAQELARRNIIVLGNALNQESNKTRFHTTYSPTIKEIVYWTNQKSINLYAEHLLKRIGEIVNGEGSTLAGIKAVTDYWQSQNIDLSGFHMADGSGLSRKDLVTTKQLVEMLLKIRKSDTYSLFYDSLPQKEEGMKAKSGTMSHVKGFVGYTDKVTFAVMINQCPNSQVKLEKINAILSDINHIK